MDQESEQDLEYHATKCKAIAKPDQPIVEPFKTGIRAK